MNQATAELIWWAMLAGIIFTAIICYTIAHIRTNGQNANAEIEFNRSDDWRRVQVEKNKGSIEAFIATTGKYNDLYDFARWLELNDHIGEGKGYELVDGYIKSTAEAE